MADVFSLAALFFLLFAGFALLAVSQKRHRNRLGILTPLSHGTTITLRVLGATCLVLGLPLALWRDGAGFGSLLWGTLLSISAYTITLILSRSRR